MTEGAMHHTTVRQYSNGILLYGILSLCLSL